MSFCEILAFKRLLDSVHVAYFWLALRVRSCHTVSQQTMSRSTVNAREKSQSALSNQAQPGSITQGLKILVSAVQFRPQPPFLNPRGNFHADPGRLLFSVARTFKVDVPENKTGAIGSRQSLRELNGFSLQLF